MPPLSSAGTRPITSVMKGNDSVMSNPHGLDRDSKANWSVCPLKSTSGKTFACVVSGPPCVPDELLESFARQAGPLVENVWKMERACDAVANVSNFIKKATTANRQLVYVTFEKALKGNHTRPGGGGDIWNWQPLLYTTNKDFTLPLRWKFGDPIGVLTVKCGSFTKMDEELLMLLNVMTQVLHEAVTEIEGLVPGDTPPLMTMNLVLDSYEATRMRMPVIMRKEISTQLQIFDALKVFAEIKSIKKDVVTKETLKVMQGVLIMLSYAKKDVADWPHVQKAVSNASKLHEKMMAIDPNDLSAKSKKVWDNYHSVIKDSEFLKIQHDNATSQAEVLLIRWLLALSSVNNISHAIELESQPAPADAVADSIFDQIDTDRSDTLDVKELVTYLVKEYSSQVAHTLLRVLDANADNRISRDEWRRGWADGVLNTVLLRESEKMKEKREAAEAAGSATTNRMDRRRRSGVLAMTAAAAAKQLAQSDPERLKELMGEKDETRKTKEPTKKKRGK